MSSGDADPYRLTPAALADLDRIWRYTAETWSIAQADSHVDDLTRIFGVIAAMPGLAHERTAFTPPVRIHVHDRHLVIYRVVDGRVVILRLLGAAQDWLAILKAADL